MNRLASARHGSLWGRLAPSVTPGWWRVARFVAFGCWLAGLACGCARPCGAGCAPTPSPNDTGNMCTAAQHAWSRCEGTVWQTCDGSTWVNTKDCATANVDCIPVAGLANAVRCSWIGPLATDFEKCTGSGQGNCADGLKCVNMNVAPMEIDASMCVTDCSSNPAVCGSRVCDSRFGWCVDSTGAFGDACGVNGFGCSSPLLCDQYLGDGSHEPAAFACTQDCGWTNINSGPATCPSVNTGTGTAETECLRGPYLEPQLNGAAHVVCTTTGSDAACDGANGYTCCDLGTGRECARPMGRCAIPASAAQKLDEAALVGPAHQCGLPGILCAPDATGTAVAVCSQVPGYGYVDTQMSGTVPVPCTTVGSDPACSSGYLCLDSFGVAGTDKYCGRICTTSADCLFERGDLCEQLAGSMPNYCVAHLSFCVDPCVQGVTTCPTGTTCKRPKVDCGATDTACLATGNSRFFPLPELQVDGSGHPVACTAMTEPIDCDQSPGGDNVYHCMDFSSVVPNLTLACARAPTVCVGN